MKLALTALAVLALVSASPARAQRSSDTLIVMTVPLKHLSSQDAVMLLQPYVTTAASANSPGGGVFPVPNGHAVTIRERVMNYGRMLKMLAEYDRSPAAIAFTFQLIVADNSGLRSPEVASLDSLLRSVLKYTGYKLIGVGVARTGENTTASESITGDGQKFTVLFKTEDVRMSGADASIKLSLSLSRKWIPNSNDPSEDLLLTTGVTVPIGQTVVIGSAALDKDRAIILTVRPRLVPAQGKGKDE